MPVPVPSAYPSRIPIIKIVKVGTTEEVEPNTEGEICVSGPTVMLGYMDNPTETAQTSGRHF